MMKNNSVGRASRSIRFAFISQLALAMLGLEYPSLSQEITWQATSGPQGRICVLALERASDGRIMAAVQQSGLYATSDNCLTWRSIGFGAPEVMTLKLDSTWSYFAGTTNGVYRSTDLGNTWIPSGLQTLAIGSIGFGRDRSVYASNSNTFTGHIYKSTDEGSTWITIASWDVFPSCIAVSKDWTVYAGLVGAGVWRLKDGEVVWEPVNNGLLRQVIKTLLILPNGDLLAGTDGGVYRSTNGGDLWGPTGLTNGTINSFRIESSTNVLAATYGGGVYRSTDSGVTWLSLGLVIDNILTVQSTPDGGLLAGTDGSGTQSGILFTSNGGMTWDQRNNGFRKATVASLAVTSSGYLLAGRRGPGGSGGGVLRSTDAGRHWIQTSGTTNTVHSIVALANRTVFYTGSTGIYRSTNEGGSWEWAAHTDKAINSICSDSKGNVYAAAYLAEYVSGYVYYFSTIYRLTTNQTGWVDVGECFGTAVLLAAAPDDELFGTSAVVFRKDSGCVQIQSGIPSATGVHAFAFFGGFSFAAHDSGVYRSTNNGALWSRASDGLPNSAVNSLQINREGQLFAGTSGDGVFHSTDFGSHWTPTNAGLTNSVIYSLAIDSLGFVYAGTGDGVFRTSTQTTGVIDDRELGVSDFRLEQNYPNPFNSATTIRFSIPATAQTQLRIFDLLGRKVATLLDETIAAGTYAVHFDAGKLASGVYYIRLQAGGFTQTTRCVLLR